MRQLVTAIATQWKQSGDLFIIICRYHTYIHHPKGLQGLGRLQDVVNGADLRGMSSAGQYGVGVGWYICDGVYLGR